MLKSFAHGACSWMLRIKQTGLGVGIQAETGRRDNDRIYLKKLLEPIKGEMREGRR